MLEDFNNFLTWLSSAVLVCVILTIVSSTFNYYMKLLVLYSSFIVTSTTVIPHGLWNLKTPWKTAKFAADFIAPVNKLLGIEYTIEGLENVDKDKAYVVVCNHQSALDVLAVLQIWKHFNRCAIVAKRELQYAGTFGLGIKLSGTVFIDRGSSEAGRAAINAAGDWARETGTSLWVFPEGTRNKSDVMLPFKKGAFHVAVNCKLPILPVVISEYRFLNHKRRIFGNGSIHLRILPPTDTCDFANSKENLNDLIDTTRNRMMEAQQANKAGDNKKSN